MKKISGKSLEKMTKAELIEALRSFPSARHSAAHSDAEAKQIHPAEAAGGSAWPDAWHQARLLDLSYDAIFIWELGGVIQYWNHAAVELYGWTREEAIGKVTHSLLQTIHPVPWTEIEAALLRDGHWDGELLHQTRDGRQVVVDSRLVLVRERDGRVLVLETNRDLTVRKQAEGALRQSEEQFRAAFENSSIGMCQAEPATGRFLRVNRRFCEMAGYDEAELLGQPFTNITHPEDRASNLEPFVLLSQGKIPEFRVEKRFVRKDGGLWWGDVSVNMMRGQDGTPLRMVAVVQDITERKRAEEELRESDQRLSLALGAAGMGIWVRNLLDNHVYWSPEIYRIFGIKHFDGALEDFYRLVSPEDVARVQQTVNRAIDEHKPFEMEFRILHPDGQTRWINGRGRANYDDTGRPMRMLGVVMDITERKQAEQTLRLQSAALEAAANGIVITDRKGIIQWANPAFARITGYAGDEILGQSPSVLKSGRHDKAFYRHMWETILAGKVWQGELINRRKDGSLYPEEMTITPVADEHGEIGHFIAIKQDVTERVAAEEELHESRKRLASVIETAMDGIITIDEAQRIVMFNAAAEEMFRCSAVDAIGQFIDRFIPERYRTAHADQVRAFGRSEVGQHKMGSARIIYGLRADGEEFPMEASISKSEIGGRILYTVIHRDVTESLRANEKLIEQAALLDQSHEAIVVRDLEGRIRYWSRGAEGLYGWTAEEAIGRRAQDLQYQNDAQSLAEATRITSEKGEWTGELHHLTKDGHEVIVEGHWTLVRDGRGEPKNILAINTDITEKKKFEANWLRAQRLESIGTLASGIAHDLNNLLSPIMMGTQMLQLKLADEQSQRLLNIMQANAQRGAEMTKQLLSFARGLGGQRVALQPKHLIREIVRIVEETFPKSIRIELSLAEGLWTINGDATQLHQMLLNLCVNARDAMPGGGTLTITAENESLDELYAQMLKGANPGQFVALSIADTGAGIPPENLDRIFDPFFTTKDPGQGTGLGLASVQGIVASHGGFIIVDSTLGRGSKFKIYLPALGAEAEPPVLVSGEPVSAGRGELILVVDDESPIREMTRTALESFGYRVLSADNGATALSEFAAHKEEVRLVITDLMMPVMDGIATIRALRKLNPGLRIIAMSGLVDPAKLADLRDLQVECLLPKPFGAEALAKLLEKSLREEPPPAT